MTSLRPPPRLGGGAAAGAALRVLAPECAEGVRARALAETRGDVEQAAVLLQAFLASPQFRPPPAPAPSPGPARILWAVSCGHTLEEASGLAGSESEEQAAHRKE